METLIFSEHIALKRVNRISTIKLLSVLRSLNSVQRIAQTSKKIDSMNYAPGFYESDVDKILELMKAFMKKRTSGNNNNNNNSDTIPSLLRRMFAISSLPIQDIAATLGEHSDKKHGQATFTNITYLLDAYTLQAHCGEIYNMLISNAIIIGADNLTIQSMCASPRFDRSACIDYFGFENDGFFDKILKTPKGISFFPTNEKNEKGEYVNTIVGESRNIEGNFHKIVGDRNSLATLLQFMFVATDVFNFMFKNLQNCLFDTKGLPEESYKFQEFKELERKLEVGSNMSYAWNKTMDWKKRFRGNILPEVYEKYLMDCSKTLSYNTLINWPKHVTIICKLIFKAKYWYMTNVDNIASIKKNYKYDDEDSQNDTEELIRTYDMLIKATDPSMDVDYRDFLTFITEVFSCGDQFFPKILCEGYYGGKLVYSFIYDTNDGQFDNRLKQKAAAKNFDPFNLDLIFNYQSTSKELFDDTIKSFDNLNNSLDLFRVINMGKWPIGSEYMTSFRAVTFPPCFFIKLGDYGVYEDDSTKTKAAKGVFKIPSVQEIGDTLRQHAYLSDGVKQCEYLIHCIVCVRTSNEISRHVIYYRTDRDGSKWTRYNGKEYSTILTTDQKGGEKTKANYFLEDLKENIYGIWYTRNELI